MLHQLLHSIEAEDCSDAPVLLKEESVPQSKVQLIEEISSTEVPEELSTPAYEMTTVRDANNKPVQITLKVELPEVSSVSECDLRISKVRQTRITSLFSVCITFLEILVANSLLSS